MLRQLVVLFALGVEAAQPVDERLAVLAGHVNELSSGEVDILCAGGSLAACQHRCLYTAWKAASCAHGGANQMAWQRMS